MRQFNRQFNEPMSPMPDLSGVELYAPIVAVRRGGLGGTDKPCPPCRICWEQPAARYGQDSLCRDCRAKREAYACAFIIAAGCHDGDVTDQHIARALHLAERATSIDLGILLPSLDGKPSATLASGAREVPAPAPR